MLHEFGHLLRRLQETYSISVVMHESFSKGQVKGCHIHATETVGSSCTRNGGVMRALPVFAVAVGVAVAAGCASWPRSAANTPHALFGRVTVALPSDLKRAPAARGIDSQMAEFHAPGTHLRVSYGSEVPVLQANSTARSTVRLLSGQSFDSGRVKGAMQGFKYGIWHVQRIDFGQASSQLSDPPRLGFYIHCRVIEDCDRVSRAILASAQMK